MIKHIATLGPSVTIQPFFSLAVFPSQSKFFRDNCWQELSSPKVMNQRRAITQREAVFVTSLTEGTASHNSIWCPHNKTDMLSDVDYVLLLCVFVFVCVCVCVCAHMHAHSGKCLWHDCLLLKPLYFRTGKHLCKYKKLYNKSILWMSCTLKTFSYTEVQLLIANSAFIFIPTP